MEGAGIVQPRRQRPGRRVDALRRPHAQNRRSDLRREADRVGGRVTFGTLTAVDQAPGRTRGSRRSADGPREALPDRARADEPEARQLRWRDWHVHRTGRSHQRRRRCRPQPAPQGSQRFTASSSARPPTPTADDRGRARVAGQLRLQFAAGDIAGQFEHYDREFVMDTAFLNRVGFTIGLGLRRLQLLSRQGRATPGSGASRRSRSCRADAIACRRRRVHQRHRRANELHAAGLRAGRPHRSRRSRGRARSSTAAAGARSASGQLFRWLRPYARVNWGAAMYYDDLDPFQGQLARTSAGALFQPNGRFSEDIEFKRIAFDRPRPASASTP